MDARSERNLKGVHPDLVRVIEHAYPMTSPELSFVVIEGLRTKARQAELVKAGASQTMNGRHLTGHAVDLMATVGGKGRWDWGLYLRLAELMKAAALAEGVPIRWGGTWGALSALETPITAAKLHKRFPDGPHYELPLKEYPA